MADIRSFQSLGLILKLEINIGGYVFEISAVVLPFDVPEEYPLLLGRPWLRTTNIKQNWLHNMISFRRGRTKIRVPTQERTITTKEMTPLYVEEIHMLEGLADEKVDSYLEENPRIVPLFEINVTEVVGPYIKSN